MGLTMRADALLVAVLPLMVPATALAEDPAIGDPRHEMSWGFESLTLLDELEVSPIVEGTPISVEAIGWYGGAKDRLWTRLEGEEQTSSLDGEVEAHLMYGRLVSAWWDAVAGVRLQGRWGEDEAFARPHLVVGLVGLAPLRFEAEPEVFVSFDGDISARLRGSYDLLITQRLVAEPEAELNFAAQKVPEWGIGNGLNDLSLELRIRYEIRRELGPYLGVVWLGRFGSTADLARAAGNRVRETTLVAGVRLWR
jgi:copper resistance protein B